MLKITPDIERNTTPKGVLISTHSNPASIKPIEYINEIFDQIDPTRKIWDCMCVAGGSIAATLFNFKSKDIDVFFYGDNLEQKRAAAKKIVDAFKANAVSFDDFTINPEVESKIFVFREHLIKISGLVNLDLVLIDYKTKDDIIKKFDLDCCRYLYDGTDIWTTPEGMEAYVNNYFKLEPSMVSGTYGYRLVKYFKRGLHLKIDPSLKDIIERFKARKTFSIWEGKITFVYATTGYKIKIAAGSASKDAEKALTVSFHPGIGEDKFYDLIKSGDLVCVKAPLKIDKFDPEYKFKPVTDAKAQFNPIEVDAKTFFEITTKDQVEELLHTF